MRGGRTETLIARLEDERARRPENQAVVDALVRKGYVERTPDTEDRRAVSLRAACLARDHTTAIGAQNLTAQPQCIPLDHRKPGNRRLARPVQRGQIPPALAEFGRASEADWRQWDQFDRLEPNGAKLLMREGLELSLPLNLAAGEIVGQVMLARDELGEWPKGTMAGFGPDPEDEAIDISEREDPYAAPEGFDPDAAPKIKRVEIADRDWMETAWVLRYEATDVFEDLLHTFDRDEEAEVERDRGYAQIRPANRPCKAGKVCSASAS